MEHLNSHNELNEEYVTKTEIQKIMANEGVEPYSRGHPQVGICARAALVAREHRSRVHCPNLIAL